MTNFQFLMQASFTNDIRRIARGLEESVTDSYYTLLTDFVIEFQMESNDYQDLFFLVERMKIKLLALMDHGDVHKMQDRIKMLETVFLQKNKSYGSSVSQSPVLCPTLPTWEAVLVRMSDKITRLLNLLKGNPDLVGESFQDTANDLIVYTTIFQVLRYCDHEKLDPNQEKE